MLDEGGFSQDAVLDLWFPENGFWESPERYGAWICTRMQGGMDAVICRDFAALTAAAARNELDHWSATAEGRVALMIALDQFSRSLWRDLPGAYAQDLKATRLVLEGLKLGHFDAVAPWKKLFYAIALGHCEGPDHLDRIALMEDLIDVVIAEYPPQLSYTRGLMRSQVARVRSVIERFGRHPHRNAHLGRVSSADEETYIAAGDFPHVPSLNAADQVRRPSTW